MTGRGLLLDELDRIVANCCRFLELVRPEQHDWRPQDGMRSLIELANHLAQIPSIDLRIIKGDSEQQVQEYERELTRDNDRALGGVMREGARDVRRFMEGLSFDDYTSDAPRPTPSGCWRRSPTAITTARCCSTTSS